MIISWPIYKFDESSDFDTKTKEIVEEKIKEIQALEREGTYSVVLHNDPINNIDYVVEVVVKVFGYGIAKALWLTLKAHFSGRSMLWSGGFKKAKSNASHIISFGPDPRCIEKGATSLTVTVERVI